jgi:tetratricopeptide (TPR) repeat protein
LPEEPNSRRLRFSRRQFGGCRGKFCGRARSGDFAVTRKAVIEEICVHRLRVAFFLSTVFSCPAVAPAWADNARESCLANPDRACLLDIEIEKAALIKDAGLRLEIVAHVAAAQAKACLFAPAATNLARAIREAAALDEPQRSAPRGEIAVAQAEAGDFPAALASAHSIEAISERAAPLAGIAAALQTAGRGDEAAPVFMEAIQAAKATPDGRAWISVDEIAKIQASANMPTAVATFDLAFQLAPSRAPDAVTYLVAEARAEAGETAEAARDAKAMSRFDEDYVLGVVATSQAGVGKIEDALASAQAITNVGMRVSALSAIVLAEIRASKMQDATALIGQMQSLVAAHASEYAQAWLYADLAGVEARAGLRKQAIVHFAKAQEATAAETEALDRDRDIGRIAIALARAGHRPEAVAMAAKISPTYHANGEALEAIAHDAEEDGDYSDAARALLAISYEPTCAWDLVKLAAELRN